MEGHWAAPISENTFFNTEASMMRDFLPWTTIAIFMAAGIWCILGARRIQKRAIEAGESLKINPFRGYINSASYVTVTRIAGVASLIVAVILLFLTVHGK